MIKMRTTREIVQDIYRKKQKYIRINGSPRSKQRQEKDIIREQNLNKEKYTIYYLVAKIFENNVKEKKTKINYIKKERNSKLERKKFDIQLVCRKS